MPLFRCIFALKYGFKKNTLLGVDAKELLVFIFVLQNIFNTFVQQGLF